MISKFIILRGRRNRGHRAMQGHTGKMPGHEAEGPVVSDGANRGLVLYWSFRGKGRAAQGEQFTIRSSE